MTTDPIYGTSTVNSDALARALAKQDQEVAAAVRVRNAAARAETHRIDMLVD